MFAESALSYRSLLKVLLDTDMQIRVQARKACSAKLTKIEGNLGMHRYLCPVSVHLVNHPGLGEGYDLRA